MRHHHFVVVVASVLLATSCYFSAMKRERVEDGRIGGCGARGALVAAALERPGLWNGGMAEWNTVFVEVPIETFSPVKTVLDLLRPEHQPAEVA